MEKSFQGDLTDILRASGSGNNSSGGYEELLEPNNNNANWNFTSGDDHQNDNVFSSLLEDQISHDTFGDPFSHMNDPLIITTNNNINTDCITAGPDFLAAAGGGFYQQGGLQEVNKYRPSCNVFSRILQINPSSSGGVSCSGSSNAKPEAAVGPAAERCNSPVAVGVMMNSNAAEGVMDGTMSGGGGGGGGIAAGSEGLQISSPRNPGAIKRRKSQAKKVVCIPAPAAANSRASGEVVPSDLWAWRKYGQKPIKGSPYPRGYYRCSSSKGCSARKQVERSRTDPNMLVITYTSEHNHPWPTQRNALAGSTRSQPTKPGNNASSKSTQIITSHISSPMEEQKSEIIIRNTNNNVSTTPTTSASVKEENIDHDNNNKNNTSSESAFSGSGYRPAIMSNVNDQDFFAELGEIEADPLNLLFSQSFSSSTDDQNQHKELVTANNSNKGLLENPFSLFDWSEGNNINNNKQRE